MAEINYCKLLGRIREVYKTHESFAAALNISAVSLGKKLANKTGWKQDEIIRACELLEIPDAEVYLYFFNRGVKRNLTGVKK